MERFREIAESASITKLSAVVRGGETRSESVTNGVSNTSAECALVAVHDAARPLVHRDDRDRVVEVAADFGAAILAHRIADTVKRVSDGDRIAETLDRRELWGAETPQVSRREWLVSAIESAQPGVGLTDESSWLEHSSLPVRVVESKHPNLKITQRDDLAIAAAVLSGRATS